MMFHSEGARPQPIVGLSLELGRGAYGVVCKAKLGSLPYTTKRMYDHLYFPPSAPLLYRAGDEHRLPIEIFEQEIELIRHPNIVLHLGVHYADNTPGPLLLMELMDGNF